MARISFNKPDENSWTPLPDGSYDLQIDEIEERTSSNNNPQLMVKCHVASGQYDTKKATIFYTLTPKATWRFKKLCDAVGVQCDEGADGLEVETDSLLGCYFVADVKSREYDGKTNNDFSNERPSALSAVAEAPPAPAPAQTLAAPTPAPVAAKPAPAPAPAAARPAGAPVAARRPRQPAA